MRPLLHLVLLMAAFCICPAQVVDRMVAVVNRHVILESELDQAARVEFLMQGKSTDKLTAADLRGVLDQLIDRALLDQQMGNQELLDPTPAELASRVKEIRAQLPGAAADADWKALLTRYGLTQQDVENQITSQVRILRFVDLRFRGLVRVDKSDIATYYQEKLLPEVRKRGASEPALAEVSDSIEKILTEMRIDEMLNNWLQTLRAQAHIEKMANSSSSLAAE